MLTRAEERRIERLEAELAECRRLLAGLAGRDAKPPRTSSGRKFVRMAEAIYSYDGPAVPKIGHLATDTFGTYYPDIELEIVNVVGTALSFPLEHFGFAFEGDFLYVEAWKGMYRPAQNAYQTVMFEAAETIASGSSGDVEVYKRAGQATGVILEATHEGLINGSVSSGALGYITWTGGRWQITGVEC